MNPKIERTPQLEESILAAIRAGSFPEVAAAAFGVPKRLFRKWKQQGNRHDPESFAHRVAQAQATARVDAEIAHARKGPASLAACRARPRNQGCRRLDRFCPLAGPRRRRGQHLRNAGQSCA